MKVFIITGSDSNIGRHIEVFKNEQKAIETFYEMLSGYDMEENQQIIVESIDTECIRSTKINDTEYLQLRVQEIIE